MTQKDTNQDQDIARIFVDEALEHGLRVGVDTTALLLALNIAPTDLNALQPKQFARIWLALSEQMGDEYFAMAKRPMPPGSFTLLGHAVRGAETFDVALRRALRFLRIVMEEPYGELTVRGDKCHVTVVTGGKIQSAFAYRTFFLILHSLNCWLLGERPPLLSVSFPCKEPSSAGSDYGDFFGVPVGFDAPEARITFQSKFLKRRVQRSEKDLKAFLRTTPEAFLRGYRKADGVKARVLKCYDAAEAQEWPDAEGIADALGMSRSTLHRRLAAENQSLRSIRAERQRALAIYLLKTTDLSVGEISARVGYAEPSAFYRAFRSWYGNTPKAFRRL